MNYADKARELRDQRLLTARMAEEACITREDLYEYFRQFDGYEWSHGVLKSGYYENSKASYLQVMSVSDSCLMTLSAWYAEGVYVLQRGFPLLQRGFPLFETNLVGRYETLDDLMNEVALEVSKL